MERLLKKQLIEIISSNGSYPCFSLATCLKGLSVLYAGLMKLRRKLYQREVLRSQRLPCTVVSVGNLTLGGTGKTPMVIHLAKAAQRMGYRAAIISRGYKGLAQEDGAVVSDGAGPQCSVRHSGDEPYLMAMLLERVPVLVGRDRYAMGKRAIERFGPDLILLDDAFQHLRIKRDLDLVLVDARMPFGNSHVLPRGRLRESISALSHADAIVLTRSNVTRNGGRDDIDTNMRWPKPVFRSNHRSVVRGTAPASVPLAALGALDSHGQSLQGLKLFGFSGLADNHAFYESIKDLGGHLLGTLSFEDHFAYADSDLEDIGRAADLAGADHLITTDKDYVRLCGNGRFSQPLVVMGVELDFDDAGNQWENFLTQRIASVVESKRAVR